MKLPAGVDCDLLRGFTDWGLTGASGGAPLHIDVQPSTTARELLLDLRNFAGLPGEYSLEARWDWSTVRLNGKIRLHKLDDLSQARVTAESSDAFVANAGWAALDVAGAQTVFVNRVALRRAEGTQEIRVDVTRQNPLRVEVDTDALKPDRKSTRMNSSH